MSRPSSSAAGATWQVVAESVCLIGSHFGSNGVAVQIKITDKEVTISCHDSEESFRRSKVGVVDPVRNHPGKAQLISDGLKILINKSDPAAARAIEEIKVFMAGKSKPAAISQASHHAPNKSAPSSTAAPSHPRPTNPPRPTNNPHRVAVYTPLVVAAPPVQQRRSSPFMPNISQHRPLTPPSILAEEVSHVAEKSTPAESDTAATSVVSRPATLMQSPLSKGGTAYKLLHQPSLGKALSTCRERSTHPIAILTPGSSFGAAGSTWSPGVSSPFALTVPSRAPIALTMDSLQRLVTPEKKAALFFRSKGNDSLLTSTRGLAGRRLEGIRNIGNSCYMNSVVQGMLGTEGVVSALFEAENKWGGEKNRPVTAALAAIARIQSELDHGVISPLLLKQAVDSHCGSERFPLNEQHDAQEFFSTLLDLLSTELLESKDQVVKTPSCVPMAAPSSSILFDASSMSDTTSEAPMSSASAAQTPAIAPINEGTNTLTVKKRLLFDEDNVTSDTEDNNNQIKRFKAAEASVVSSVAKLKRKNELCGMFTSVVENQIVCNSCGKERKKEEQYQDFSLEILDTDSSSSQCLEDLLSNFFAKERRELACEHCKDTTAVATVSSKVVTFPDVLVIHLKRFRFDKINFSLKKCNVGVTCPQELNMSSFADPSLTETEKSSINNRYKLSAVVRHLGADVRCGHYVTDVVDGSTWKHCDDSVIKTINQVAVLENIDTPYMLFYARKKVPAGATRDNPVDI